MIVEKIPAPYFCSTEKWTLKGWLSVIMKEKRFFFSLLSMSRHAQKSAQVQFNQKYVNINMGMNENKLKNLFPEFKLMPQNSGVRIWTNLA